MAEYNPSKIIKDGNTYNFRDDTKIPLAGSNAISGDLIPATDNTYNLGSSSYSFQYVNASTIRQNNSSGSLLLMGGSSWDEGASIVLFGKNNTISGGGFRLDTHDGTGFKRLEGFSNGTLTWNGQPIQISSDQRLKQQITEIDDDLLTAWEDVEPVQFKYNDAVEEKSDNARLHTGYVVQQIDDACKKHNVDVSKYGLYCHEEYAEETEEVEVEQKDGTKTKERKVIREASEHYSLRYTEALIVECAYLRKKNKDLQEQLDKLSARLDKLESASSK